MMVRVMPLQPHCFAFGGFELQMLDAMESINKAGIVAKPLDMWSRDGSFDVMHVWGLSESHLPSIQWAKKSGKKIVLTALLPYVVPVSPIRSIRTLASQLLGRMRVISEILSLLDKLVVVNEAQAESAEKLYHVPTSKIAVIPNIIADVYFDDDKPYASLTRRTDGYIICSGNICQRKNQLNLVKAALAVGVPLLLVGPVLTGSEVYADEITKLIAGQTSVRWVAGLTPGSPELISAYRESVGFALPSYEETQPISALEAAAARKPLLLADRPWARQSFYRGAYLVEPESLTSIQIGLKKIIVTPNDYIPNSTILSQCRNHHVGKAYVDLFNEVMGKLTS